MDTYGSRSLAVGGVALHGAAQKIVAKARTLAAHQLEVGEDELEYEDGTFSVERRASVTIKELAFAAWTRAQPARRAWSRAWRRPRSTTRRTSAGPAGRTRAVVEVDTETGDVGSSATSPSTTSARSINPTIVDGQIHGGVAQGVAQALYEEAVYDEDGNLLTVSMTNYLVPSAAELPSFELDRTETPSPTNPLGVKGVGETGTIAAPAAVMNAVADALAPFGVTDIEMPATPERVWRALEEARR